MLKFAILLFNTLALLIYQFLFSDGITVTQVVPSSAKAESEFTVELTINKGTTGGFAKLQEELPAGFTAVEDKSNGASFTFSNQFVKFIWMSLPADKEFKVSFKVKVDAGISGAQAISGKFSYVTDNVKQTADIAPATITIGEGSGEPAVAAVKEPVITPETGGTEPETPVKEPEVKGNTGSSEASPVTCVRKAPKNVNGEFTVEINVNKGNLGGFAKLLETLPTGFTATAGESSGASFSFADQKVRFIWVSLPPQAEFTISYKVAVASTVSEDQVIDGVFSYIENDNTKKFAIPTSTISIGGAVAGNPPDKDPISPTDKVEPETTAVVTPTKLPPANNIPPAQGNANYKVQIMALHNPRSAGTIASIYHLSETVSTEMGDGFKKYTVGSFNEYKAARDNREKQRAKGVVAPFVTAYINGKRKTVQEALMVSSQKWVR